MASTAHSLMGSLLLASVLCQGVPVLPSEVLSDEWLSDLVSALVRVRTKYSDLLQPSSFDAPRTLQWHGPAAGSEPAWEGSGSFLGGPTSHNFISLSLCSSQNRGVYVALNPHDHPTTVSVPGVAYGCSWRRVVDSSLAAPDVSSSAVDHLLEGGASMTMAPKSSVLLEIKTTPSEPVRLRKPPKLA